MRLPQCKHIHTQQHTYLVIKKDNYLHILGKISFMFLKHSIHTYLVPKVIIHPKVINFCFLRATCVVQKCPMQFENYILDSFILSRRENK